MADNCTSAPLALIMDSESQNASAMNVLAKNVLCAALFNRGRSQNDS